MKDESTNLPKSFSESWRKQKKGIIAKEQEEFDSFDVLRIGGYVRLSPSGDEREEGSLVSHPQRIKDYIKWKNRQAGRIWGKITNWYVDKDQSGKDMNRPEFQRMCEDIEKGLIDAIVVTELSRLSRNVKDFCHIWDFLKEHNVKFISLKEDYDTSSSMGELMLIQSIGFAQFERNAIVERIKNGARARAERGLGNGYPNLGFDLVPHKPNHRQINKDEKPYIQMIFKKMLELGRMKKLLDYLNDNGYRTKQFTTKAGIRRGGKRWTMTTLHQVLTNRSYIGQREFNKRNRNKDQKSLKKNDRYFFIDATWPALVKEELFLEVQSLLEHNKKNLRQHIHCYRLSGLVKCAECGTFLCGKSGTSKKGHYFYYGHKRRMKTEGDDHLKRCHIENIPAPQLEELVLERLKSLANDKALLSVLVKKSHSKESESHASLKSLINSKENQRRKVLDKIDNVVASIEETSDRAVSKTLQARIPQLDSERQRLTDKITSLRLELGKTKEKIIDAEAAFSLLQIFNKGLLKRPLSGQIHALKRIIKEVVVYEDRVLLRIYGAGSVSLEEEKSRPKAGEQVVGNSHIVQSGRADWI